MTDRTVIAVIAAWTALSIAVAAIAGAWLGRQDHQQETHRCS